MVGLFQRGLLLCVFGTFNKLATNKLAFERTIYLFGAYDF